MFHNMKPSEQQQQPSSISSKKRSRSSIVPESFQQQRQNNKSSSSSMMKEPAAAAATSSKVHDMRYKNGFLSSSSPLLVAATTNGSSSSSSALKVVRTMTEPQESSLLSHFSPSNEDLELQQQQQQIHKSPPLKKRRKRTPNSIPKQLKAKPPPTTTRGAKPLQHPNGIKSNGLAYAAAKSHPNSPKGTSAKLQHFGASNNDINIIKQTGKHPMMQSQQKFKSSSLLPARATSSSPSIVMVHSERQLLGGSAKKRTRTPTNRWNYDEDDDDEEEDNGNMQSAKMRQQVQQQQQQSAITPRAANKPSSLSSQKNVHRSFAAAAAAAKPLHPVKRMTLVLSKCAQQKQQHDDDDSVSFDSMDDDSTQQTTTSEADAFVDDSSSLQRPNRERINGKHAVSVKTASRKASTAKKQPPILPGEATYSNLFRDDGSGRKPVHSYTLNYAIQLIKKEAEKAVKAVVVDVKQHQQMGNKNRNLSVAADKLSQTIVERVRLRLRETKLPAYYARAADTCLESLADINRQRRGDMEQSSLLLGKLRQQRMQLEGQLAGEEKRKKLLRDRLAAMEQVDCDRIHPLLLLSKQRQKPATVVIGKQPSSADPAFRSFCPAPPGTMARLCEAIVRDSYDPTEQSLSFSSRDNTKK